MNIADYNNFIKNSRHGKDPSLRGVDEQGTATKEYYETNDYLISLCDSGKTEEALSLIKDGADINYYNGAETPLSRSILKAHTDLAKALVDHGANIDVDSLATCSLLNNTNLMESFIEKGANLKENNFLAFRVSKSIEMTSLLYEAQKPNKSSMLDVMNNWKSNPRIAEYVFSKWMEEGYDLNTVLKHKDSLDMVYVGQYVNSKQLSDKLSNALPEKSLTKAQQLSNDIESEDFSYKPSTTRTNKAKL